MDHLEAASLGATEKYLLGMLDEAQRDAFEEHFFDCLECADDVRAAAAVLVVAGSLAEATPRTAPAAPTSSAPVIPIDRRRRRLTRAGGTVAALGSLAAAASLVAYQGLVVIPRLRDEVRAADSLQAVPSQFLRVTRSEEPRIRIGPGDRQVALTLSRSSDQPFPSYRCELRDASGRVVRAATVSARSATDEVELLLPVKGLPDGRYVLVVEGVGGAGRDGAVTSYSFRLERGPSPAADHPR